MACAIAKEILESSQCTSRSIETRFRDIEYDLPSAMQTLVGLVGLVALKLQISSWQSMAVAFQDVAP